MADDEVEGPDPELGGVWTAVVARNPKKKDGKPKRGQEADARVASKTISPEKLLKERFRMERLQLLNKRANRGSDIETVQVIFEMGHSLARDIGRVTGIADAYGKPRFLSFFDSEDFWHVRGHVCRIIMDMARRWRRRLSAEAANELKEALYLRGGTDSSGTDRMMIMFFHTEAQAELVAHGCNLMRMYFYGSTVATSDLAWKTEAGCRLLVHFSGNLEGKIPRPVRHINEGDRNAKYVNDGFHLYTGKLDLPNLYRGLDFFEALQMELCIPSLEDIGINSGRLVLTFSILKDCLTFYHDILSHWEDLRGLWTCPNPGGWKIGTHRVSPLPILTERYYANYADVEAISVLIHQLLPSDAGQHIHRADLHTMEMDREDEADLRWTSHQGRGGLAAPAISTMPNPLRSTSEDLSRQSVARGKLRSASAKRKRKEAGKQLQ